ncbi:MAG: hypothetical protein GY826_31390, partial [Fuerstiella sp.]|nr:hypothetical protein [Fuerstiella sp.]
HKYDPIPTSDYYALYGIFDSCAEQLTRIDAADHSDAFEEELKKRQTALQTKRTEARSISAKRARSRVSDYLKAQTELHRYPLKGFDQIFEEDDLLPAFVRRWETWLRMAERRQDPVFLPWQLYRKIPPDEFSTRTAGITAELRRREINPIVATVFSTPPTDFQDVIDRYAEILTTASARWENLLQAAAAS